jgi:carotenoid cleavage dioxygenase-like enzyme
MTPEANWPAHPNLQGGFAPQPRESDFPALAVTGEIPRELVGTLYRNGPNPQFPPRGGSAYHWFDGDGMIHAISFEGGRAAYRNRWVRTRRSELERKAGKALFGGLRSMSHTDPDAWRALEAQGLSRWERVKLAVDAANTNVIWHAGRLLALLEVDLPTELDPRTLDTRGRHSFGGKLATEMTAHPKVDPETGELLLFGYSAEPPFLRFHVADRSGRLTRSLDVPRRVGTMMHDFVATRRYAIFPEFPVTIRPENLESDDVFRWEPELGARVGILPRAGGAGDAVWFELEACFVYHFMNAHEVGSRVVVDAVKYPRVALFPSARRVRRPGCSRAGASTSRPARSAKSRSTTRRSSSRGSTSAAPGSATGTVTRSARSRAATRRCRSTRSCTTTSRAACAVRTRCPTRAPRARRCSSRVTSPRPKATASCSRRSTAGPRTAATCSCSTLRTSRPRRSRWCTCRSASRSGSMGTLQPE